MYVRIYVYIYIYYVYSLFIYIVVSWVQNKVKQLFLALRVLCCRIAYHSNKYKDHYETYSLMVSRLA